jgi:hypothetical protein
MTVWTATLDAFEQRLEAQWAALHDASVEPVPAFEPPPGAAVLPDEHVACATELVWRCRALEEALAAALAKVTDQLDQAAEPPAGPPAEPVYFDSRI